jgi:hypothetical protein
MLGGGTGTTRLLYGRYRVPGAFLQVGGELVIYEQKIQPFVTNLLR